MMRRSLRFELLAWLLLPLAAVVAVNVWTTFRAAVEMADLTTDRMLVASALAIAEQTEVNGGVVEALIPPVALEMFNTGNEDRVYYRVENSAGRLLAGYPDLPPPSKSAWDAAARLDHAAYRGFYRDQSLHLVALTHPVVGAGPAEAVHVMVGVTLNSYREMVRRLWLDALGQQVLLLVAAGCLAIVGLARGLAPLMRLRDAVQQRPPNALDPFAVDTVQSELRPLVTALNQHMERVRKQMAAQRRFVANAAHQLRTPLTLLNMQATYALRETELHERDGALAAIQRGTQHLAHLAGQLLTLSRASSGSRRPRQDPADLGRIAGQVMETLSALAVSRRIDLALEAAPGIVVPGDETMLREMIVNLVDNALRYTPAGGSVTVGVKAVENRALLQVQDTGPGIPADEREHVFERFYRLSRTTEATETEADRQGSGLGLAIVREIVDAAGGEIDLRDPPAGTGLLVEVSLPMA